jgi:oligopeptide/dipeptide ABC transporter ATP-binding protein
MTMKQNNLIEIKELKKYFKINSAFNASKQKFLKAVDGVSFEIKKGETFGLVGESGCGKSTLGRTITRLYEVTDGQIIYDGVDIARFGRKQLQPYRRRMQAVFQDPYSAFNPHMNIREIIAEPMDIHMKLTKAEQKEHIVQLLERVGLKGEDMERFPHEFSGGQRQRIGIARALSINPEFILCDEPISALDVSIQAQVVNRLEDLQQEFGLTYLFVAHDLSMVKHISSRIGVMYLGKLVEIAEAKELYKNPMHPYTKALLASIPIADPIKARGQSDTIIEGDLPSPFDAPSSCSFRSRCPYATAVCAEQEPILKYISDNHQIACHLY